MQSHKSQSDDLSIVASGNSKHCRLFLVASWLTRPPGSCCSEKQAAQNNFLTIVSSEVQVFIKLLLICGIFLLA